MRRIGDIWSRLTSIDNLSKAADRACSSRKNRDEVNRFEADRESLLVKLQDDLRSHRFRSSSYRSFLRVENGKEREIADIQLYPDRIVHWAIAMVLEPYLDRKLIDQVHGSRPGHGIHSAVGDVSDYLRKDGRIMYCLKLDVRHFFHSIDKIVLKRKLRTVIKDRDANMLLDEIIDGFPRDGIPIGNRTSPIFANLYLSEMDHLLKEVHHVHYYVRYMDDIVILGYSKPWLRRILNIIRDHLSDIGLEVKGNWQIFPVDSRGIDFVGYVIWRDHVMLRKSTKVRMKRAMRRIEDDLRDGNSLTRSQKGCIDSYSGILKWCDSNNLRKTVIGPVMELLEKGSRASEKGPGIVADLEMIL